LIDIIPLGGVAPQAVEDLLDDAFGRDRHMRTAYRLRAGVDAIENLSFAALENGVLVGSIQSWPVQLADGERRNFPLILVGPIAVRPDRQRDGIGRMLTAAMLAVADAQGSDPLVLIGDPEYYDRFFGFSAELTGQWDVPGPVERRRLLARVRNDQPLPLKAALGPRIASALVHDKD